MPVTPSAPSSPAPKRPKKPNYLLFIGILLFVVVVVKWQMAEQKLTSLTLGDQQTVQDTERAKEITEKVKRLMDLDDAVPPTVASIVDVELLREKNPFYDKAENGDYLLITPTRAILYDPDEDKIIDVVAVQIQSSSASLAPTKK